MAAPDKGDDGFLSKFARFAEAMERSPTEDLYDMIVALNQKVEALQERVDELEAEQAVA